jgi:hypothetical protein
VEVKSLYHRFWFRWHEVAMRNAYEAGRLSVMLYHGKQSNFHETAWKEARK